MTHPLHSAVKAYDVRGVVEEGLGPEVMTALGVAIAEVTVADGDPPLVIGHDMRESSPALADALAAGAGLAGVDTDVVGLVSTDQLYFVSGQRRAPGVMITASHNPARYNGLKLCRAGARPVSMDSGLAEIRDRAIALDSGAQPFPTGSARVTRSDTLADYARHLRRLVPLEGVRPLRVVVDAGNGMAGLTAPAVLSTGAGLAPLPIDLVGLYLELDGTFPHHEANPLEPENLRDLQEAVRGHGADLGLAFDGDADRCFVVDESGAAVDPGAVTALVARREIARVRDEGEQQPAVLHNLITSRIVPDVVSADGGVAVRTRVGHSFIKAEMARTGAVFGGEHSAHYYFRDFYGADSGMLAAMHVLAALGGAPEGTTLSSAVAPYQRYSRSGEINSVVDDAPATMERVVSALRAQRPGLDIDRLDGVTLIPPDEAWWANIRPSNTEPLLRLNVEAGDAATMEEIRDTVLAVIRGGPNGR